MSLSAPHASAVRTAVIPQEVEAKLTLARSEDARAIADLRNLDGYQLRPLPTQHLRSTYLDTPSFSLARHGVALRVRRHGDAWEATAKWGGRIDGAVHERAELTVPLTGRPRLPFVVPDGPLAVQLTALVAGGPLNAIFETSIRRQPRSVLARGARTPLAELAIDCVTLSRPRGRHAQSPYWELEVELLRGSKRDLIHVTHLVRRLVQGASSMESKFTRGMRIFHPTIHLQPAVHPLTRADTAASAVRALVARHLGRVRRYDPATRTGKDPDAVHDIRVAFRRLRATLRTFKKGCPKALRTRLIGELRWIEEVLGTVRDVDVQLAHLAKIENSRNRAAVEPLRQHLAALRRRHQAELKAALKIPRYTRLLAALDLLVTAPPRDDTALPGGSEPISRVGRRALRKGFRRLRRDGRRAMSEPTDERLHTLRISAKRTRYVLEFLKNLTGKPGTRLTKTLIELQDELGMQHDAVVAMKTIEDMTHRLGPWASDSVMTSLQQLATRQKRDAGKHRRAAAALWKRFTQPRRRGDMKAVLDSLAALEARR